MGYHLLLQTPTLLPRTVRYLYIFNRHGDGNYHQPELKLPVMELLHNLVLADSSKLILLLMLLVRSLSCLGDDDSDVAVFIFGDSIYDPGNNNHIDTTTQYQANFSPYGESFFNYPTGRFSDGRLIPDFIAEYANLPMIPPYLEPGVDFSNGANFASGGGGALDQTYPHLVISLETQMKYFEQVKEELGKKLGKQKVKHLISNSVYMLSIGGNDLLSMYATSPSVFDNYTPQQYVDIVIGNISVFIQDMYSQGARKFGFITIPPVGCMPINRQANGDCAENMTALTRLHNKALYQSISKLEQQLDGLAYSIFDFHTALIDRMNDPSKYGLVNGTSACCGSGMYRGEYSCGGKRGVSEYELCEDVNRYLFFDAYHPTQTVYQQCAILMWNGSPPLTYPTNLRSLFQVATLQNM